MKTSRNFYQTILTAAVVLLSVVTFAQDTGEVDNPFSVKKFRTIRGDVNKSNPVEGNTFSYADQGSLNQTDGVYNSDKGIRTNIEKSNDVPRRERQSVSGNDVVSAKELHNSPNPFSQRTLISYEVENRGMVSLSVYYQGSLVTVLTNSRHEEGQYEVVFEGGRLRAGTYELVFTEGREVKMTRSMYKIN